MFWLTLDRSGITVVAFKRRIGIDSFCRFWIFFHVANQYSNFDRDSSGDCQHRWSGDCHSWSVDLTTCNAKIHSGLTFTLRRKTTSKLNGSVIINSAYKSIDFRHSIPLCYWQPLSWMMDTCTRQSTDEKRPHKQTEIRPWAMYPNRLA